MNTKHLLHQLEKYFNAYSLLALNALIVILSLNVGGGTFFFESGIIHVIAILFILLATARIFLRHYTYDPILEKFVHAIIFATIVFACSHVMEFVSLVIWKEYKDVVFANVANLYLVSIFAIIIGAGYFLEIHYRDYTRWLRRISFAAIAVLLVLTITFFTNDTLISLEPDALAPYLYSGFLLFIGIIAFIEVLKVGRATKIARGFSNYLLTAVVFILFAAFVNIFYEVLIDGLGFTEQTLIYLSHFAFYGSLSIFFLSFGKFSYLGGAYEEVRNLDTI